MVAPVLHGLAKSVGPKPRPVAVGGPTRRVFASMWDTECRPWLEEAVREVEGFGVNVCGSVERFGLWVQVHRVGWLIALDAANALNSMSRVTMFGRLNTARPFLLPFVGRLLGGEPPSLIWVLGRCRESLRGRGLSNGIHWER